MMTTLDMSELPNTHDMFERDIGPIKKPTNTKKMFRLTLIVTCLAVITCVADVMLSHYIIKPSVELDRYKDTSLLLNLTFVLLVTCGVSLLIGLIINPKNTRIAMQYFTVINTAFIIAGSGVCMLHTAYLLDTELNVYYSPIIACRMTAILLSGVITMIWLDFRA